MTRTPEFGYSDDALRAIRETAFRELWAEHLAAFRTWANPFLTDSLQQAVISTAWDIPPDPVVDELRTHYTAQDALPTDLLRSRTTAQYASIVY